MKTKKVLLLTENFPPLSGGSGRWFWELYSRLDTNQYLIVANNETGCVEFDKGHSLPVHRMPLSSVEWGIKSTTGFTYYWRTFNAIRKLVKQHDITEIHCGRVIPEGVVAYLVSLFTGISYCCYVHGEDVETAATSREHDLMVKLVCKRAKKLICNSKNTANIVTRLNYSQEDKIHILHPGVDANRFVPQGHDIEFRQQQQWLNRKVVLTVGRLQARKGQDMMIRAMSKIKDKVPEALYVIVGKGECEQQLQDLREQLGLEQHVQFLSEVSDQQMIACYQQCDLFILPNRTIGNDIEGFGMVLVEAQACSKPVIAGDSGGTKETMKIEESGLVIDCTEPDNIAENVIKLLSDGDRCERMGNVGRQHVEENLDWRAHVNKAKSIFEL